MSSLPQTTINFTDNAAFKVKELMDEEGDANLNLRIYITGGGCSGFQYNFSFDADIQSDDTVVAKTIQLAAGSAEVKLLIDPLSLQYLVGAEIDYEEKLGEAQFVIRNPNAKTTCGCGSSFAA